MITTGKRWLAILLCIVMCISQLPISVLAEEGTITKQAGGTIAMTAEEGKPAVIDYGNCGEEMTWILTDDGALTISGTGDMWDYSSENLTFEDRGWNDYCGDIKSVVIRTGATSIGDAAFAYCESLTDVTIPHSVTNIGADAFNSCSSLESIEIPDSVTGAGEYVFFNCISLTSVVLSNSLTSIGPDMFEYCESLTDIEIPDRVTSIEEFAFNGCTALEEITFGRSVETIGYAAFCDCDRLDRVYYTYTEEEFQAQLEIIGSTLPEGDGNLPFMVADYIHVHTPGEIVRENEVAATCIKEGSYDEVIYCTVCGEEVNRESKTIEKIAHSLKKTAATAATCTEEGSIEYWTCSMCKKLFRDEAGTMEITDADTVIPALGHRWGAPTWIWALNCSSALATFTCENDSTHKEIVTAVEIEAVAEGDIVTYTAMVNGPDGKTYSDEKQIDTSKTNTLRIYGASRYETCLAIAEKLRELRGGSFENVVVACGSNFPDALAGSYLAVAKNAPILLVSDSVAETISSYIATNMNADGTIYILGSEAAVSAKVEQALSTTGRKIERLAGKDRYLTNIAILEEAGIPDGSEVLVCVGTNYADSLSASSSGLPILMVDKNKLSAAQEEYLETLKEKGCRFTIIGSPAAVSEAVEAKLSNYSGSPIERVAGKTRYETSIEVAEHVFEDPDSVVLTVGNNFPDGLSAGPLAYELGAPVVLTLAGQTAAAEAYAADLTIKNGIAVGGSNVLSNGAVMSIFGLVQAGEIVEYTR